MTKEEALKKWLEDKEQGKIRTFYLDGLFRPIPVGVPYRSCFFCKKCTDIWWDYSNGPYMTYCEEVEDTDYGAVGQCEYYEDDGQPVIPWKKGGNDESVEN